MRNYINNLNVKELKVCFRFALNRTKNKNFTYHVNTEPLFKGGRSVTKGLSHAELMALLRRVAHYPEFKELHSQLPKPYISKLLQVMYAETI